jgi:hypothetical protein
MDLKKSSPVFLAWRVNHYAAFRSKDRKENVQLQNVFERITRQQPLLINDFSNSMQQSHS